MGIMYKIYFDETASVELRSIAAPFGLTVIDRQPEEGSFLIADESGISLCRAGEKAVSALILMEVPHIIGALKAEAS